jgi:hypothetical protein
MPIRTRQTRKTSSISNTNEGILVDKVWYSPFPVPCNLFQWWVYLSLAEMKASFCLSWVSLWLELRFLRVSKRATFIFHYGIGPIYWWINATHRTGIRRWRLSGSMGVDKLNAKIWYRSKDSYWRKHIGNALHFDRLSLCEKWGR